MKKEELPFELDASSDVPPWLQLRRRLISLINTGYYKPGDQLPTVRALASKISINFNTVNKTYLSLVADGYLESTRGRGVFVCNLDADYGESYTDEIEKMIDECILGCRAQGLSLDDIQKFVIKRIKKAKKEEGRDQSVQG